jgi:hypothetical protein
MGAIRFSIRRYTAVGRKRTAGFQKALQVVDSVRENKFRAFVNGLRLKVESENNRSQRFSFQAFSRSNR